MSMIFNPSRFGGSYIIPQSIRFAGASSMSWTIGTTADSDKITTHSIWIKRCALGAYQTWFDVGGGWEVFGFFNDDKFRWLHNGTIVLKSTQVFRDPSAWYHIVARMDTTQATEANRCRLYVNGTQITTFDIETQPAQSTTSSYLLVNGKVMNIGFMSGGTQYFDGYLSEHHCLDGVSAGPEAFGEFDANGVWVPKVYTGTYGTNGFYISGANSAALGTDYSGNGNTFTTSGLTTADQMLDTPTDSLVDGLGNYAVLSPINKYSGATLEDGNLVVTFPGTWYNARATIDVPSTGKWSFRVKKSSANMMVGVIDPGDPTWTDVDIVNSPNVRYYDGGEIATKRTGTKVTEVTNAPPIIAADTWMEVLINMDDLLFGVVIGGTPYSAVDTGVGIDPAETQIFVLGIGNILTLDFGADGTYMPSQAGYKTLCTASLPAPATAASVTPLTSPSFIGNVSTDGPFVWLGYTPDEAGTSTINGNTITWGTDARATAGGFKVITTSTLYNSTGTNTISIAVKAPFGGAGVSQAKAQ